MTVNSDVVETQMHEEELVSGHDAKRGGMDPALLGMMLFIASEVMFFAALFAATSTPRPRCRSSRPRALSSSIPLACRSSPRSSCS
jgi:heme/copper-type cytochrome/quinol oxidase subunit 3